MNETIEERLINELRRVSNRTDVPPAPVQALMRAGDRRIRRSRTLLSVAAVAAVALVILAAGLGPKMVSSEEPVQPRPSPALPSPTTTPSIRNIDELPDGALPSIPYWHRGVLHVGGTAITTPLRLVVTGGDTVLVGASHVNKGAQWWLVDGDRLVLVMKSLHPTGALVSTDGRLVLWQSNPRPDITRVTAWDVATKRVLAHRDLNVPVVTCCGGGPLLALYGADSQGRVYWSDGNDVTVWHPYAGTVSRISGLGALPHQLSAVAPFGPMFQGGHSFFELPGVYGRLDAAAVFHRSGTVPVDYGVWSPDGTFYAYVAKTAGPVDVKAPAPYVFVENVHTHDQLSMNLPPGAVDPFMWESADTLLVQASTDFKHHYLIRCGAGTGNCEMALRIGRLGGWSFPDGL